MRQKQEQLSDLQYNPPGCIQANGETLGEMTIAGACPQATPVDSPPPWPSGRSRMGLCCCTRVRKTRRAKRKMEGREWGGGGRRAERGAAQRHAGSLQEDGEDPSEALSGRLAAPAVPDAALGVLGVAIVDAAFVLVVVVADV